MQPRLMAVSLTAVVLCLSISCGVQGLPATSYNRHMARHLSAEAAPAAPASSSSSSIQVQPSAPSTTKYGHKHLVPLSPNDIGLCITVAFSLFIASGAGVGGGILVVPALLMIGGFGSVDGVGLSNITVLSLAVAAMFFQIARRSPVRDGPLIDWDLVMLFGPPSVVGSISGSYINMIIPSWVTKVTLLLLLLPITWRMIEKARTLYKKENAAKRAPPMPEPAAAEAHSAHDHNPLHRISATFSSLARSSAVIPDEFGPDLEYLTTANKDDNSSLETSACDSNPLQPLDNRSCRHHHHHQQQQQQAKKLPLAAGGCSVLTKDVGQLAKDIVISALDPEAAPSQLPSVPKSWLNLRQSCYVHSYEHAEAARAKIVEEEAAQLPVLQVGLLVVILASVVITNITGGYLVQCGTWRYWLLVLTPLPLMIIVWGVVRQHVLWKGDCKRSLGLKHTGDLKWDRRNTVLYPLICISAGLIAGLLGLGGGLILTPLMLELGVHPAVSVASSQITMMIGNSTSAIVYAVAGAIPWDYGATLVTIGFISALMGQIIVSWLVRKLGRSSLIVMVLCVMFTLATGAALTVVITTMVDISKHPGKLTAHKAVCIK